MEEDCLKEIRCPTKSQQAHPAYSRYCDVYKKKEREILKVKHKKNAKARKIVGFYMGDNTYTTLVRRADLINQENKYRALVEKMIQL